MPLDEDAIDEYKRKQMGMERMKSSHGARRNDLNPKVDLTEFLVNNRQKFKGIFNRKIIWKCQIFLGNIQNNLKSKRLRISISR